MGALAPALCHLVCSISFWRKLFLRLILVDAVRFLNSAGQVIAFARSGLGAIGRAHAALLWVILSFLTLSPYSHLAPGDTVWITRFARHEVTGKLAPPLLDITLELLPPIFNTVPVHGWTPHG